MSARQSNRKKNMNVKFSLEEYEDLQKVADDLGGMPLSSMVRIVLLERLKKVKKTGNPKVFIEEP